MEFRNARYVNIAAGAWLVLSALLWPHSRSQYVNTWFMGVLAMAIAAFALRIRGLRYLNTVVGGWLIISAFALPTIAWGTRWNNFIIGVVIVGASLVGTMPRQPASSSGARS
jgi:hypothetical protein